MTSEAARLEALDEADVRLVWRKHELTIPRAVEDWPLDEISEGRIVDALEILIGGQTAPIPLYEDALSLSNAMAAAVGVDYLPETPQSQRDVFGAIPLLLYLLATFEDDVASDLRRFWSVDYLDRWRGSLTLRQIWTFIRRVPVDSSLAVARNGGRELWTRQQIIGAQNWEQLARKVYLGRPMTAEEVDQFLAKQNENARKMDKLADGAARYAPDPSTLPDYVPPPASDKHPPQPSNPALAAANAIANRRRELSRKAG